MQINSVQQTDYITLAQAANQSPGRPSANAVWRWCRKGIKSRAGQRIRLKHIRAGGRVFTSEQWLNEFFQAVAQADQAYFERPEPTVDQPPSRTDKQRQGSIAQAERELKAAGI